MLTVKYNVFIHLILIFGINKIGSAQIFKDTSVNYINRIASDSEAIIKINQLLSKTDNSVEVRAQLQLKLVLRTSNMGKF